MKIVPIDKITVNRAERQRKELLNIEELADSIRARTESLPETGGLINPIVVTRELVLVAGERRFTACRDILKRTEIAVTFADELDPGALRAIELEENIKREELPWQDYCLAVKEFHELRKSENPDHPLEATADALGLVPSNVFRRIAVADEILKENPRILQAPKYSVARGIVERLKERAQDSAVADIRAAIASAAPIGVTSGTPGSAPAKSSGSASPANDSRSAPTPAPIAVASFLEWAPTYSGPKFNFIHCDFPYGIDADKFNQGGAAAHGGYKDSEDYYWQLLRCLADNLDRIAAPSCHIMFWFSMKFYSETVEFLRTKTDFIIDDFPLIWSKSDNVGILPDPSRGPRRFLRCLGRKQRSSSSIYSSLSSVDSFNIFAGHCCF